ncbi:MAG TPA: hypothetical protein VM075_08035 [Anaerolineae bacterium]|nr:hypothetical protein [Anaerolineae bacterium]
MEDVKVRKRKRKVDIELIDPAYKTGMLDGYAKAIQELGQVRRDKILERIVRRPT